MHSSHSRDGLHDGAKQRPSVIAARLPPLGVSRPPVPTPLGGDVLQRRPSTNASALGSSCSSSSTTAATIPVPNGFGDPLGWVGDDRSVLHSSLRSGGGVARRRNAGTLERLEPLQRGDGNISIASATGLGLGLPPVWAPPRPLPAAMLQMPGPSCIPRLSSKAATSASVSSDRNPSATSGLAPLVQNLSLAKASSMPSLIAPKSSLGSAADYAACDTSGRGSTIKQQQQQQQQQQ
eukprot:CAMPEP_0115400738 /NCGR_PEP_ID=MMETSP0271-20121206/15514_1 /TAXON_ID=71861 /ORGANISM="Scrippsiella trochoidea, Strain CCMP3099" /LENGTH=235 /DNA_ID=CAMNT_0002824605 /DNA_START=108 /DNA_END=812 /DNA_ORIENTATION=-